MVAVSSKFTESQVSGWPDQGGFHQGRRTEPGLEELMHMPDFGLAGRLLLLVLPSSSCVPLGKKHGETPYLGFFDHENKATDTCQTV